MATPLKGFEWVSQIGSGSGNWIVYLLIILFFVAIAFLVYVKLKSKGKTYKTTIWEYVGDSVRKVTDTMLEKEDKDKTVMFKLKRAKVRVPVTMKDATVTVSGKATFDLIKIDDHYFPMRPTKNIMIYKTNEKGEIQKGEDGNPILEELSLVEFGAKFKLHEIKSAAHKIGQDSKIYSFWEKNAALMQFVATMTSIMIPFVLMLIIIMKIGPILKGLNAVAIGIDLLVDKFSSIATSFEVIAQHLGGIVPPPG